ncbi:hypothetical protein COZ84_00925 [Candidatus Kuenenbacteria bacterium CG_4_8_14_3_um_filter_39_15]|uniref:Uncharacterized protein n=1 Tax=Candidatus Kuenenbacteria bacterium CG_4_8_14_3_um_filter_39_15 TaxID=1974615 RepID=A0A2M7IM89_9BACT|nr:MAG: hypothetical protein COZ84_00925 [Candidatus Kuenenbacteria bacterium CG_4_8_14_3_um_filter_39_15]
MNEQFKPESIKSPEKSADQLYEELNQTHDEVIKLMDQVHELEMKAGKDGLSKEEFDSIVDERNKLATQFDEKWEYEKRLEEEWKKAEDKEIARLEEEYKKLEE